MPTLSARADRATGTVTLTIDDTRGVQALIRTDANGTRPVRMTPGNNLPGIDAGTFVDYEAALGGWVSYRLDHPDFEHLVWANLTGDWAPRFIIPTLPEVYAEAQIVTAYDSARASTATFHDVIGREDPLVVEGRLSSRRGKLVAQFDELADSAALEALLRRGKTVLYRQSEHPGMDMYFHTSDLSTSFDPEHGVWTVELSYVEVSFPAGEIASSAGWTFTAAKLAYRDFTEMSLAFESFQHLALGESYAWEAENGR